MSRSRLIAEKLAKETTRLVAIRWGESFPFYYVSEHPKSGGTWVARMVADCLDLPFPRYIRLPLGFSCVIQNHWRHHPRLRRVFYVYRDGRDVMTSFYYDRIRISRHSDRPGRDYLKRTYERLFGKDYDPADIVRHLPRFIEHEFAHPGRGTPLNWRDHVDDWHQPGREGRVALLAYEDLRRDCAGALGRAIEEVTGEAPEPWRLENAVEKLSMKRQTGREPGQADVTQHIRKGIVGDWQNAFSREAAEVFNDLAGDALVRLGYEADKGWVDRYEYPAS